MISLVIISKRFLKNSQLKGVFFTWSTNFLQTNLNFSLEKSSFLHTFKYSGDFGFIKWMNN